ncbi:MAG: hypothetical protein JW765_02330 [Deltaproteobacteria bacterium]|nr:hypothetical protein [Candidatus Zymogenaceae bacterium]
MRQAIVGLTLFSPLCRRARIIAVVLGITIDKVKIIIDCATEIVSFCGHSETAAFLGVPYCRDAAPKEYFKPGTVWVGIRPPIDRPCRERRSRSIPRSSSAGIRPSCDPVI